MDLREVVVDAAEVDPEPPRRVRDRRALDHHREEDDDEDDAVQVLRAVHALEDGERSQEDGNGALEAAPDDEEPLAPRQASREEEGKHRERPRHEHEDEREDEAVAPRRELVEVADRDRQPEGDEGGDLGEPRERGVEVLDLALPGRGGVAQEHAGDEDREKPRPAHDGREPVDDPRSREHPDRVEGRAREADPTDHGQEQRARPRHRPRARGPSRGRTPRRRSRGCRPRPSRARSSRSSARSPRGRSSRPRPRGSSRSAPGPRARRRRRR